MARTLALPGGRGRRVFAAFAITADGSLDTAFAITADSCAYAGRAAGSDR